MLNVCSGIFSLDHGEMFAFVFLHRIHILIFMKLICLRPVCIWLRFILFASSLLSLFVLDRVLDLRSVVAPLI